MCPDPDSSGIVFEYGYDSIGTYSGRVIFIVLNMMEFLLEVIKKLIIQQ